MSRSLILMIATAVVAILSVAGPARAAGPAAMASNVGEFACTEKETWSFSPKLPAAWRNHFLKVVQGKPAEMIENILMAQIFRNEAKLPDLQAFGDYWLARAFYQAGLLHLAKDRFLSFVRQPLSAASIGPRMAAVSCLNTIQNRYPTMVGWQAPVEGAAAFKHLANAGLKSEYQSQVWQLIASYLETKMALGGHADIASIEELRKAPGGPPYFTYLEMQTAAQQSDEKAVVRFGEAFVKADMPKELKNQIDPAHILLGGAYYGLGMWDKAAANFREVKNTSNYFTQAQIGACWASLRKGDYAKAVSSAQDFLLGGLRKTFAPEANMIVAMSLNEVCRYREAIESIKYFRKKYQRVQQWLSKWNERQSKKPIDLYNATIGYLQKKYGIPDRIGTEWVGSPVFIGNQDEINLILDEKKQVQKALSRVAAADRKKGRWAKSTPILGKILNEARTDLAQRERQLIAQIQTDLTWRTRMMVQRIGETLENMELIDAEVYSSFGEKVISEQILDEYKKRAAASPTPSAARDGSVWDWGKFSMESDDAEVWEDELGFLQADVSSQCHKQ